MMRRDGYIGPARSVLTSLTVWLCLGAFAAVGLAAGIGFRSEQRDLIARAVVRAEADDGDWVFAALEDGAVELVSGSPPPAGLEDQAGRLARAMAQRRGEGEPREWLSESGALFVLRVWRAENAGQAGVRVLAVRVGGLDAARRRALTVFVVGSTGVVLVVIWGVARSRRSLRGSVRRMATAVTRVGKSERMRDVHTGSMELAPLADALQNSLRLLTRRVEVLGSRRAEAKAILRSMPGAVIALDLEQRIVNANRVAERVLDIDAEQSHGRLLQELVRQPALLDFVSGSVGATDLRTSEFSLRGVTDRVVAASSRPLLDADKELVGVVVVLQDVTRLRKLENLRRDFASNASHELRTPVTNILGYIETLADYDDMAAEERLRFIDVIRRNAERLAAIIEDMLDLARLEAPESTGRLQTEEVVVREMLEDLASGVVPDLERKGIGLSVECDGGLVVEASRGLMGQAVGNLLANAIRYSPEHTTIRLSGRLMEEEGEAPRVELAVEDQGLGIPEEHLSRLFERFYRVDPARSRELGGTGLGLAIAKHVAMLHGGEIGVTSEVGEGSRFWIRTPQRNGAG